MAKTKCLSATALRLFNDGQLSRADIELVGQHLEDCSKCLQRLDNLDPGSLEQGFKHSRDAQQPEGEDAAVIDSNAKQILDNVILPETPTIDSHHGQDLFQLKEPIGETGFGQIFAAIDLVMQRPATIIMPDTGLIASIDHRAQFIHDASMASSLKHENIMRVIQFGSWNESQCYLAMPQITSCSLERILQSDEKLDLRAILVVVGQICQALKFAHGHNVVHRHLKPTNIFVSEHLGVQVSEFGLTVDGRYQFGLIQPLIESTRYNSPESVRNMPNHIDVRTDVFSVGAILESLLQHSLDVDPFNLDALLRIAHRCQRPSRRNRYQTIEQLIETVGEQVQVMSE